MPNVATRLITLIMLLQRQPGQKAKALAEELGVSVRTLHRYIGMLDEMGIPVYSERGPGGGFSLVRGYRMPPLVFTPEEAVSVYLGTSLIGEMWGDLYREAAQGVLSKLDNVLPEEQRHEVAWARRTLLATGMHRSDLARLAPYLEKLRLAVRERRRVEISYRSREQLESVERLVDPLALVHRWGLWYWIGYCHLRQDLRTFRVDRIQRLNLRAEIFEVPSDFDVHAYLETEPHMQTGFRVRMRFSPQGAYLAHDDRVYWDRLEENPDGSVIVEFPSANIDWASRTALSYGRNVEVIEPGALRQRLEDELTTMSAYYQEEKDG